MTHESDVNCPHGYRSWMWACKLNHRTFTGNLNEMWWGLSNSKRKCSQKKRRFQLEEHNQWYLKEESDITVPVIWLGNWPSEILMKTISVQCKGSMIKPDREIPAAAANGMFNEHTDKAGIHTVSATAINIVFIEWMLAFFLVWIYNFLDEKGAWTTLILRLQI